MDISFDVVLSSPADQHAGGTGHQTHRGLATRDFMTRLCTLNPSLPPLVLVLKQFLLERGLLDPYTGGLPSYALTIMVGSLLQPHALEPPDTHPDLGSLLLTFLKQFRCALLRCDGIMRSPDSLMMSSALLRSILENTRFVCPLLVRLFHWHPACYLRLEVVHKLMFRAWGLRSTGVLPIPWLCWTH